MYIANTFVTTNDGYNNGKITIEAMSPHTKNEKFEGITLSRITFLVYIGLLKPHYLQLVLELSEDIRKRLIEHLQVKEQLFFSYTHLVCRSALPGISKLRTDLSHMIHADNCNLLGNHICEKKPPAFYWRDYSAILYLNEEFDGGEFIFASETKGDNIQSTISPKCGRMVAFSSGIENLHGVKAVTKGKRCALALWFTLDPKYQESDRDIAQNMLDNEITFQQYSNRDISEFLHGNRQE